MNPTPASSAKGEAVTFDEWFKAISSIHPNGPELDKLYQNLHMAWKAAIASQMTWEEELQHTIGNQNKAIDALKQKPCPHISTTSEGTSHCELAEKDGRENARLREQVKLLQDQLDKQLSVTK